MSDNKKTEYKKQYNKEKYKQIKVSYKPEDAEEIKTAAAGEGKSIAGYILGLHKKHMEEKNGENQ